MAAKKKDTVETVETEAVIQEAAEDQKAEDVQTDPEGKQEVTKIIYSPWHFRYVGIEEATKIHDSGLTMEESHAGRHITDAQFNALVEDLIQVMTARGVPVRAQNRLLLRLAPMHGDIVTP